MQDRNDRNSGILYLVATPIGNLSDISERAVLTLRDVDFIAAEDTRVTRKLTTHLKIKKPLISYRAHNQREAGERVLSRIISGESCALVTDAGMPGVSDPGEDLVRLCTLAGVPIVAIPGPCAAVSALALSGLATGRFTFEGFLPPSKNKRLAALRGLKDEKRTMVFYEAPHRLVAMLADMHQVLGNRRISISREMTKMFEETLRLALCEAVAHFEANPPRGEFALVVEGAADSPAEKDKLAEATEAARSLIAGGMSARDAVKRAATESGCPKNELYKAVVGF